MSSWPSVSPTDITKFDYSTITEPIDLISGGPPCQPFSNAGKHLGVDDERDLFGEVSRAMRCLRPRAILIENTNGLAGKSFLKHMAYITLQLTYPEMRRKMGERWRAFLKRLDKQFGARSYCGLQYNVKSEVHNAADFGNCCSRGMVRLEL